MNTAVSEACAFGAELSRYAVIVPSSASAAEHNAVDVSMRRILSMSCQISIPLLKGNMISAIVLIAGYSIESAMISFLGSKKK